MRKFKDYVLKCLPIEVERNKHIPAIHQAIKYLLELQTDKKDVRDVLR